MNSALPSAPPDPDDKDAVARARRAEYDAFVDKRLTVLETRFDAILPTLATRADIAALRGEVAVGFERLRTEMAWMSDKLHQDMNAMSSKLHEEMNASSSKLHEEMNASSNTIREGMNVLASKLQDEMAKLFQRMVLWTIGIFLTFGLAIFGGMIAVATTILDEIREVRPATAQIAPSLQAAPALAPQLPRGATP
ncbi:MAG: hypothetical protein ACXWVD_12225 [Telluria sp.]